MNKKPGTLQIVLGIGLLFFTVITFQILQYTASISLILIGSILTINSFFHRSWRTGEYSPSWLQLILGLLLLICGYNWFRDPESFINSIQFWLGLYLIIHGIGLISTVRLYNRFADKKVIEQISSKDFKVNKFLFISMGILNLILGYIILFFANDYLVVTSFGIIVLSHGIQKKLFYKKYENQFQAKTTHHFTTEQEEEINKEINDFIKKMHDKDQEKNEGL